MSSAQSFANLANKQFTFFIHKMVIYSYAFSLFLLLMRLPAKYVPQTNHMRFREC